MREMMKQAIFGGAFRCLLLAAAGAALMGCGSSRLSKITDDGRLAEQASPVWPGIEANRWQPEGSVPNPDNLAKVQPGLSKEQVYGLIGRPHFAEGMIDVREWDYVLNLSPKDGGQARACQYKLLFDKRMKLASVIWRQEVCAKIAS
ncbi:outer membrane protein assembly factor BamE [Chromobacterium sp. Panama]|nr:outer membrane protein assembly factor BamE [Chromobacterium sp. Panama]